MILGTVLVGVMLSKSRHTRQLALSRRKSAAVRAADELITKWWASADGVPVNESGRVKTDDSLRWQSRFVKNRELNKLDARVVRVEIHELKSQEPQKEPLVAVELVLPRPPNKGQKQKAGPKSNSERKRVKKGT